jgi:hypothetical protein
LGLDQDPPTVDNRLDDLDLDIRVGRNLFAWMNNYTLNMQNQTPVTVDTGYGLYNGGGCGNMLGSNDYLTFKYDWKDSTDTGILCRNKTKTLNSFYFYFGLNKNKTALSKTLEKYFSPCPVQEQPAFTIISDATDVTLSGGTTIFGSITLTIIGGTGPYTVTITYPAGTSDEFPVSGNTITFDGLVEGSYPITVTDSSGLVSTTTVIVGGPIPLNCFVEGIAVSGFNSNNQALQDGIINIEISDGIAPYTVFVTDIVSSVVYYNGPTNGSLTVDGLPSGTYSVFVTDSSAAATTCQTFVGIGIPEPLEAEIITISGETCENSCNGYIQIELDGQSPYNITLNRTDGALIQNNQQFNITPNTVNVTITGYTNSTFAINSLCSGDYTLNVIDANGQAINPIINVTIPPAPYTANQLALTLINNIALSGTFNTNQGTITITPPIPPQSGNYTYYLYDTASSPSVLQTITSNAPSIAFSGLGCNNGDGYWITYKTDNNCRFPTDLNERFEIPAASFTVGNLGC